MKKYIYNEHEAIVSKYVLHHKNEDEASSLGRKKNKKCKRVVPSTITKFFSNARPNISYDPPLASLQ
jgi:hypothetical protein